MKVMQEIGIDTKVLYEKLIKLQVGEVVEYKELSALVRRDVQDKKHRHILTTAKKHAQKEGIIFGTIRNVGMKRLNDEEIVGSMESYVRHVRNTSRRKANILTKADYKALSPELKIRHGVYMCILAVANRISQDKQMKKLGDAVGKSQKSLSLAETLDIFKA